VTARHSGRAPVGDAAREATAPPYAGTHGGGPGQAAELVTGIEELEAVVRRELTRIVAVTLREGAVPVPARLNRCVTGILTAARAYAAGDSDELTAARREFLRGEA